MEKKKQRSGLLIREKRGWRMGMMLKAHWDTKGTISISATRLIKSTPLKEEPTRRENVPLSNERDPFFFSCVNNSRSLLKSRQNKRNEKESVEKNTLVIDEKRGWGIKSFPRDGAIIDETSPVERCMDPAKRSSRDPWNIQTRFSANSFEKVKRQRSK